MVRNAVARYLVSLLAAASLVVFAPSVALASCAEPLGIDMALLEAETVFVGEVISLDFSGRVAEFDVIEVWHGQTPGRVTVNGGPDIGEMTRARAQGIEMHTSVDRTYAPGETYLVFTHGSDGSVLLDNGCSSTQPFTVDLESLRPPTAGVPSSTPPADPRPLDEGGGWGWAIPAVIATAGIAAAGLAALAVRSKRERDKAIW